MAQVRRNFNALSAVPWFRHSCGQTCNLCNGWGTFIFVFICSVSILALVVALIALREMSSPCPPPVTPACRLMNAGCGGYSFSEAALDRNAMRPDNICHRIGWLSSHLLVYFR